MSGHADPDDGCYDAELPFLGALEREVERFAQRKLGPSSARPAYGPARAPSATRSVRPPGMSASHAHRRAPGATRTAHAMVRRHSRESLRHDGANRVTARVARRSLTLVALLLLVGASAFGARLALSGRDIPNPLDVRNGRQVLVAHDGRGSAAWSLSLYERGGELCRVLTILESESSRCSPAPGVRALSVDSAVSPLRRYVFGVAGPAVRSVVLQLGALHRVLAPRPLSAAQARTAGLPLQAHYFAIALPRPPGRDQPARVVGLDAHGRPLDGPLLACPEALEQASGATGC